MSGRVRALTGLLLMLAFVAAGALPALARSKNIQLSEPKRVGGQGGYYQGRECPEGRFLVGAVVTHGDWIDSIIAVCAPVDKDTRWPPLSVFNPMSMGRVPGGALPDHMGGPGGSKTTFMLCPMDTVVTQIQVSIGNPPKVGKTYVQSITFYCSAFGSTKLTRSNVASGKSGGALVAGIRIAKCPPAHYAFKLSGKFEQYVDSLGLDCELVGRDPFEPVYGAPAPAPPRADEPRKVDRTAPIERVGRDPVYCVKYAQAAVETKSQNDQNRCGLRGPRHDASFEQHLTWCQQAKTVVIEAEARARAQELAACQQCRKYARETMAQFSQAFAKCGRNPVSGPLWSAGTEEAQFSMCFRNGAYNPDADRNYGQRASDLRKC